MSGDLAAALVSASKRFADPIAASYASGNRAYNVQLKRPGPPGTFNRDTNSFNPRQDVLLYTGPARIYLSSETVELPIGDETRPFNAAMISIDYFNTDNAPNPKIIPRVDDIVVVVDDDQAEAGHLPNRIFEVTGVEIGGHFGIGWTLRTIGAMPSRENPGL